jgi:hypothetical protein
MSDFFRARARVIEASSPSALLLRCKPNVEF